MIKPSRRAVVIAASFALGLSAVGPAAHAGLLGGSDDSTAVEGIGLPVGGDLLGGDLLGGVLGENGLLGGDLLGGHLGEDGLLGGDLLGDGLPLVGDVLGGDLLGEGLGGDLLGDGLPLVGDVLGGDLLGEGLGGDLLGDGLPLVGGVLGEDGVLGGELLDGTLSVVTDATLDCDAAIPQVLRSFLGDATDVVCEPFSDGILGLLSSL